VNTAVDVALAVAEVAPVGVVGDAAAGAVGLDDTRQHLADAGNHVRERRDVRRVVGRGERARVLGVERVAARFGSGVRVLDVEQAGDGLLLEPLARVARCDAGGAGKPVRGLRAFLDQCPVEAELGAEVDGEQLERAERGAEQALGERVGG
jgi:hypothetical protein